VTTYTQQVHKSVHIDKTVYTTRHSHINSVYKSRRTQHRQLTTTTAQ